MRLPIDVHIGAEKTGTTSIQHYLARNRETLRSDHGILFPASLGPNASYNLAAACQLSPTPDALRQMLSLHTPDDVDAYYTELHHKLQSEISDSQPKRLILSCENFSSRLKTGEEVSRLRDFLAPFASSFRVLVYLRRQDKMITSAYSTRVKNGLTRPFRFPLEGDERHDSHFDQLLDRWAEVFGEDCMVVRLYEPTRLHQSDGIADFCQALGIPADLNRSEVAQNTSLTSNMLEFMRSLNHELPYRIDGELNPLRADIEQALAELNFPGSPHGNYPGNADFYRRYQEGNRKVAQRWFKDDPTIPPELFKDAPSTPTPETGERLGYDQLVKISAHFWNHCQQQLQKTQLERDCLRAELLIERGELKPDQALELANRAAELAPDGQEIRRFIEKVRARTDT